MHDLVQAASRALSANDPETLERLAVQAGSSDPTIGDDAALARAIAVLTAQVDAAAAHIALRSRMLAAADRYEATPWDR